MWFKWVKTLTAYGKDRMQPPATQVFLLALAFILVNDMKLKIQDYRKQSSENNCHHTTLKMSATLICWQFVNGSQRCCVTRRSPCQLIPYSDFEYTHTWSRLFKHTVVYSMYHSIVPGYSALPTFRYYHTQDIGHYSHIEGISYASFKLLTPHDFRNFLLMRDIFLAQLYR